MNANQKRLVTLEGDNPASRISGLIEMRHCLQKDVALAIGMSEQVFSNKMNGLRSLDPWPADNPQPEEAAK